MYGTTGDPLRDVNSTAFQSWAPKGTTGRGTPKLNSCESAPKSDPQGKVQGRQRLCGHIFVHQLSGHRVFALLTAATGLCSMIVSNIAHHINLCIRIGANLLQKISHGSLLPLFLILLLHPPNLALLAHHQWPAAHTPQGPHSIEQLKRAKPTRRFKNSHHTGTWFEKTLFQRYRHYSFQSQTSRRTAQKRGASADPTVCDLG